MQRCLENGYRLRVAGISGEFQILDMVGRGSSCVVYRADYIDHDGFRTAHLLKEYNPAMLYIDRLDDGSLSVAEYDQPEFDAGLMRFCEGYKRQSEIRQIEGLTNTTSNIQSVFDANGTKYIDMTVFEGSTYGKIQEASLYQLLRRMKALTEVVGNYHRAGFLHLDIKPENIFVLPETPELVMLFDFDSVVEKNSIAISRGLSYTQDWAAPEQRTPAQRRKLCEATDFYAIGEIIFWQIFGRHSSMEDRHSFSEYSYDYESPILQNVNPRVLPLLTELLHKTLCGVPAKRFRTAEELIQKLDELIVLTGPRKPYLVSSAVTPNAFFIGRDAEIDVIHQNLQQSNILFLSGIGGIGKSELAKNYAVRYAYAYDVVLFATYSGSWVSLINGIAITNFDRLFDEKEDDYYNRKIKKLSELCDKRTLLIIDNLNENEFENNAQKQWEDILKLSCKKLVTTRLRDWEYDALDVDVFSDRANLVRLFNHFYPIKSHTDTVAVNEMINYVNGHTLTLELIARQTKAGFLTPEKMLRKLINYGIAESGREKVVAVKDNMHSHKTVSDHISAVFDIASLNDEEKYIMANMSLVSPNGILANLFAEWCGLLNFDFINQLIGRGWLRVKDNTISLHPVVSEIVFKKLVCNCDIISTLLNNFCNYVQGIDTDHVQLEQSEIEVISGITTGIYKTHFIGEEIADIFDSVACIIFDFGQTEQAVLFLLRSLELRQQLYGEYHEKTATSYNHLGIRYRNLGYLAKAEHYLIKAYELRRKILGTENLDTSISLYGLGFLYDGKGVMSKAEELYLEVYRIRQKLVGEKNHYTASVINSLGKVYLFQGEHNKAFEYLNRAYTIRRDLLGKYHPDTAGSHCSLGQLFYKQGKCVDAEKHYKEAYEIYSHLYGKNHRKTLGVIKLIGELHIYQGNLNHAQEYLCELLSCYRNNFGDSYPATVETMYDIAKLHMKKGDYDTAKEHLLQAYNFNIQLYGPSHPKTLKTLSTIGALYWECKDFSTAKSYYINILCESEKLYGNYHPQTATVLSNLGVICRALDEFDESEEYQIKALSIRKKLYSQNDPKIAISMSNLGTLHLDKGNLDISEQYYQQAYQIRVNMLGTEHPHTALSLRNFGNLHKKKGNIILAIDYYEKALKIYKNLYGINHPLVNEVNTDIAELQTVENVEADKQA